MKPVLEADGVVRIPVHNPFGVYPTNVYLLAGDRLCLVDVGPSHPRTWEDLVGGLRALGHRPDDVDMVVLSHGHADHDGLAHRFPGAILLIGAADLLKIAEYQAHLGRYEHAVRTLLPLWGVVGPDVHTVPQFFAHLRASGSDAPWARATHDGDLLEGFGSPWRVVDLPGHTEGLIGLYRSSDGVLISSDQLLEEIVPNPALYFALDPPGHGLGDYERSLRRISELWVTRVLPGHGPSFTDCPERVAYFLDQLDVRLSETASVVATPLTVAEVARLLFPGCDRTNSYHLFITLVESFARLEVLCSRGILKKTTADTEAGGPGVWRYEPREGGP